MATCGQDDVHMPRAYHPSPWGDFFLTFEPCTPSQYLSMQARAEAKKQQVRQIILDTANSSHLPRKLELVDTLQRIGLDYHYGKEIDALLRDIHDDKDEHCDLHTTALRFYLLRKHGYHVSPDVFSKFIDEKGNIASSDATCLISLYDAAHLRIHGEKILDNAIIFTKRLLQSMVHHLDATLAEEVQYALETPLFRRLHRVEANRYISTYEKKATRNETILELAKLDYNMLQSLYCEELKNLTLWWNALEVQRHLIWARDRMVEMHFWMLGVFFEPQYSYPRTMLTKLITLVSVFDDFYDNYSTTEESKMFTTALESWDERAAEQAPAYMKPFYKNVITSINDIEEDLKLQKNKHAELVKKLIIDMANCYHVESKWRDQSYVPSNIEEHLRVSMGSSGCMHISNLAFLSMGDIATTEAVYWAWAFPKIIRAVCVIGRVANDIVSHEREQASHHVVSTVQTCMKEYGITVEQANEKLKQVIEEAWMDINEECMQPTAHPMTVLQRAVNLARTMDFLYKREDAYTLSYSIKQTLTSVYVQSMEV